LLYTKSYHATDETCVIEWTDQNGDQDEASYLFTGYADGQYEALFNGTRQTLNGVAGAVCGDTAIDAIKKARTEFPQGDAQKIWYDMADPSQFVFDDDKPSWKYAVFGGAALVIGAVATTVSAVLLIKMKCPNLFKRALYTRVDGGFEMDVAK
jgi:hypothetical protein